MTHPMTLIPLVLLLVVGMLIIGVLIAPTIAQIAEKQIILGDHAESKHGIDAAYARQCAQDPSAHLFINHETGRKALVCLTDRGWGLFIYEETNNKIQEITSFIRNKARTFGDVIKYLKRAGYELVQ